MGKWIKPEDQMPQDFVSVLGCIKDNDPFPSIRECYAVDGKNFFFPALGGMYPITHWMEMPEPPKEE